MMYEQFITKISSIDFNGIISKYTDMLSSIINNYLSETDNLRMASVILMITALIMFLLLMVIVYIKSIFVSFKGNRQEKSSFDVDDDIFDEEDARELQRIIEDHEREIELEKELQRELEMAQADRDKSDKLKEDKKQEKREKEELEKKTKKEAHYQEQENKKSSKNKQNSSISLDWEKGKLPEDTDINVKNLKPEQLSYHQLNLQLNQLTGLIIDMLGRGVDDLKIAQTVMFRNHYSSSEEDVLQLIDAIKDFIETCRKGSFDKLNSNIPSAEQALYHLSEGDPALALMMIEALMDSNINIAGELSSETKKSKIYTETSQQALVFGNLAAINDVHLATGSFELAIELEPHNISAWSRLGDMYTKAETTNKAIWAYQNILDMTNEEINPREVANAQKNISQHLYAQGNSLQAAKLYNSSKQFYDSLGINRRLDKQEAEIVEIIEANHKNEIMFTIQKLLASDNNARLNFG